MTMNEKTRQLVWDVPTRVFHWMLAASFAGAYLTSESERYRDVHVMFGYTMAGLVLFRLVWGIVGTRHARFSSFAFGPKAVLTYVKSLFTRRPQHFSGHNPAGSWAIYGLLLLALLTGATGYATLNDIGGGAMEEVHEAFANGFLLLVGVHIAGVLVSSLVHGENLVRAMITGTRPVAASEGIRRRHRLVGAALVVAVAAFWVARPDALIQGGDAVQASAGQHAGDRDDD